jgi:hypothetical protein
MYDIACSSMCRINRNGATLMRKYGRFTSNQHTQPSSPPVSIS